MPFYAVHKGEKPGVYNDWYSCEPQVKGYKNAKHKKFDTREEAEKFVEHGFKYNNTNKLRTSASNYSRASTSRTSTSRANTSLPSTSRYSSSNSSSSNVNTLNLSTSRASTSNSSSSNVNTSNSSTSRACTSNSRTSRASTSNSSTSRASTSNSSTSRTSTSLKRKCSVYNKPIDKNLKLDLNDHSLDDYPMVFTDGACINNGKKGAKGGYGVWWSSDDPLNLSCRLKGKQTNNRAEIAAIIAALKQALDQKYDRLVLCTDSKYVINSINLWSHKWKENGWMTEDGKPVKNKEDFIELLELVEKIDLVWKHVKAHKGEVGNEMADKLAKEGMKK